MHYRKITNTATRLFFISFIPHFFAFEGPS